MRLWLSKDSTGYMLTALAPKWRRVGRTDRSAWYARPGEPICVRHLCDEGIKALTGMTLKDGEIARITLTAQLAGTDLVGNVSGGDVDGDGGSDEVTQ